MENDKNLHIELEKWFEEKQRYEKMLAERYPSNPPNNVCRHALLSGVMIENSFKPAVHEYTLLFQTEYEKVFIWTHSKDTNSVLISEVVPEVKSLPFWKTIGHILHLANYFYDSFEISHDMEIQYNWVYYFDPNVDFEDLELLQGSIWDKMSLHSGVIKKATDLEAMAPLIELLLCDDTCYIALSQMLSSFQTHYCCLICELGLSPIRQHESHEPKLWERGYLIPKMEPAIVQACRCVESILGEPPNRNNKNALLRHKTRWIEITSINPDDLFEKTDLSYLDFYYKLFFDLRNPSAHSYGNIPFELERKRTIEAQCFAALVLRGYICKHQKSDMKASSVLSFNQVLLSKVVKDMSTKMTE